MIECKSLVCGYHKQPITSELDIQFYAGGLHVIIGNNGVGKSTLLKTLIGSLPPVSGNFFLSNQNFRKLSVHKKAKQVAYVQAETNFQFQFKVFEIVAMGRQPYRSSFGKLKASDAVIVLDSLKKVGMETSANEMFHTLSDGQKQRVLIARALAQVTPVIILDEPTSHLDIKGKIEILKILKQLSKQGKTIIYTSHNLELALQLSDSCLLLKKDKNYLFSSPSELAKSGDIETEFCGNGLKFHPEKYHFFFDK